MSNESLTINQVATQRLYINWPAVFAGNAVAGGLILVLLPLGLAAGLTMTSPYGSEGASARTVGTAAVLYVAFMYLFSIAVGGYFTGRLRPRVDAVTSDEIEFRDMANGFVFWGVGMVLSALFTFFTATTAVRDVAGAAAHVSGAALQRAVQDIPMPSADYATDFLLRSTTGAPQGATPRSETDVRAEVGRILAAGAASGQISDDDKQYVASLVAQRTGISEADAKNRVDNALKRAEDIKNQAMTKAKDAAEQARKGVARGAFWTAVLSLLSGIAAAYAARIGGRHRDENRY